MGEQRKWAGGRVRSGEGERDAGGKGGGIVAERMGPRGEAEADGVEGNEGEPWARRKEAGTHGPEGEDRGTETVKTKKER